MFMFGYRKKINKLLDRIYVLEQVNESLQQKVQEYDSLLKQVQELNNVKIIDSDKENVVTDEILNCTPKIDFERMKVISIERMWKQLNVGTQSRTIECTIIGYIKKDDTTFGEWMIVTSSENHEKLVKEFEEYLKIGRKTTKSSSRNKNTTQV
jgi:hypothetical protein